GGGPAARRLCARAWAGGRRPRWRGGGGAGRGGGRDGGGGRPDRGESGRRRGHGVVGGARTRFVAVGPATGRAHRQLLARMENRAGPCDQPRNLRRFRRGPGALDSDNVGRPGAAAASGGRRARVRGDGGAVGAIYRGIAPTSAAVR